MTKRVLFVVLAGGALAMGYMFYGRTSTPKGQPPLVHFSSGDLTPLKNAFNSSASATRVLVMLSPT